MKIFRYLIFISILCGIFFVIYQKCDEKGFRRWRTSFKTAIIFSAIAAGLITVNTKAIEPTGNNNQVYQERLLSDQEFNSFEAKDQKVILVKTGDIVHLQFRLKLEEGSRIISRLVAQMDVVHHM